MKRTDRSLTQLLLEWNRGKETAQEELLALVYGELRRLAARKLELERQGHTLQPTALVHEVYLRLVDQTRVEWQNRAQFFAIAAQTMRRILVDHARRHQAKKRGAAATHVVFDESLQTPSSKDVDVLALNDLLKDLAELDERQSRIVEMRFFGGLQVKEIAEVLSISPATVKRDWSTARAWLYQQLKGA